MRVKLQRLVTVDYSDHLQPRYHKKVFGELVLAPYIEGCDFWPVCYLEATNYSTKRPIQSAQSSVIDNLEVVRSSEA